VTLAYCGQTVGWIKLKLGVDVDFGPGHIVLDGDPTRPQRGTAPNFRPVSVDAKRLGGSRIKMPLGTKVCLGPSHIVLDGDPSPAPQKGHSSPKLRPMSKAIAKHLFHNLSFYPTLKILCY